MLEVSQLFVHLKMLIDVYQGTEMDVLVLQNQILLRKISLKDKLMSLGSKNLL